MGVTPRNILHASRRRNDGLARIFHDLKLMEREGSGIDLLFEHLLTSGRKAPTIAEGADSVHVTVPRRVVQPAVIRLLAEAEPRYQLTQRERIVLALIAQTEGVSAGEVVGELELPDPSALRPWLGRLLDLGLVEQTGRTTATRYFVPPALLRQAGLDVLTTLKRVHPSAPSADPRRPGALPGLRSRRHSPPHRPRDPREGGRTSARCAPCGGRDRLDRRAPVAQVPPRAG
jgi:ATP-dependent DNA helicase RecG